jgi:hypothetical protein
MVRGERCAGGQRVVVARRSLSGMRATRSPAVEGRTRFVRMRIASTPAVRHILRVSKYSGLRDRLRSSGKSEIRMSFNEISDLVPGGLPPSADRHDAWWSNEDGPGSTHSQSRLGWMAAGYRVVADRSSSRAIFTRCGIVQS